MTSLDPYHSPLWDLGVDEVEHMMCADTIENRRKLRAAGWFWESVSDEEGVPTGLIKALGTEVVTARRENVWDSRKPIMVDPANIYSEYLSPLDYPSDYDCPWWIKNAVRQYIGDVNGEVPEEKRTWLPTRCKIVRNDGTRCWNWVSRKRETKCKQHLGWTADEHTQRLRMAKSRVIEATTQAVDTLEGLMLDSRESGAVRLKASTEILDRAGLRGGTELDISAKVEMPDAGKEVQERLARLADRMEEAAAARAAAIAKIEAAEAEARAGEEPETSLPLPSLPSNHPVVSGEVVPNEPRTPQE